MIGEFMINIVFEIAAGVLSMTPDISWSVDTTSFEYVSDILRVAGYLFPMKTVVTIVELIIGLNLFRFAISVITTIWDLLPFA